LNTEEHGVVEVAYWDKNINYTITYVKCDSCGAEKELGNNLNFDGRMNCALQWGYTFKANKSGQFENHCRACVKKMNTDDGKV
jgi:hypothetical protein